MKNYIERLNNKKEEMKKEHSTIHDYTYLYIEFVHNKHINYDNYIWIENLKPFLKEQYSKRRKKENFNRKLFSKIIFNNLYRIRQYKDDKIPFYANKGDHHYNFYASHQHIRRELEKLSIDEIIVLSYELSKIFK